MENSKWFLFYSKLFKQYPIHRTDTKDSFFSYAVLKKTEFQGQSIYPILDCHLLERSDYSNYSIGEPCIDEFFESRSIILKLNIKELVLTFFFFDRNYFTDFWFIYTLYNNEQLNISSDTPINKKIRFIPRLKKIILTFFATRYLSLKLVNIVNNTSNTFVLPYYNTFMLAVIRTSNLLNKNVVEIQHGLINSHHEAYNKPKIFKLKSTYKPKGFIVFDAFFAQYMEHLTNLSASISNYKHLHTFSKMGVKKNKILYSMQWGRIIPKEIEDCVKSTPNMLWVFRFHPFENQKRDDINILKAMPNVEFEQKKNLSLSLSESILHITMDSSVCYEAREMGVLSFYLDENAIKIFHKEKYIKFLDPKNSVEVIRLFLNNNNIA